jgi:hypothetical protein
LDKIETLQESFADALKRRRELTISFMKDEEYSYEDYKQKAKPTKASETLAKIKPWEQLSDEQLMYQHAESYAEKARKRQRYSRRPKKSLGPEVPMDPITISSLGHDVALEPGLWSSLRDKKLADLDGVIYSTAKEKIVPKEPLSGFIEPHLVESFIRQNRYQLQLCYELALRRDEAVSGKTEWRWRIDSRGTISDLELIHSSIKDRQLMKCLEDKISRWRFPRPRRGAVEVSYPFEFAPNKG